MHKSSFRSQKVEVNRFDTMQIASRVTGEVALQKDASSAQPEAEVARGKAASESAENEGKHVKTVSFQFPSFQFPALIFLVSVFLFFSSW